MMTSGMNIVMTVIGFVISTVFIISVCTSLVCTRIASRREQRGDLRLSFELREQNIHGLEQVIVAKFPTTNFNRHDFPSKEDAQCSICLGEYQERDILKTMPKCGHAFHVACIDTWLLNKSTCPVCRLPLRDAYHDTSPTLGMAIQRTETPDRDSIIRRMDQEGYTIG